jgi:hypothetical protein
MTSASTPTPIPATPRTTGVQRRTRPSQTHLTAHCPECGTLATGRFCFSCGAAVGEETCPSCHGSSRLGSRYCTVCGATMHPGLRDRLQQFAPWLIGGSMFAVLLVGIFRPLGQAAPEPQGLGAPPQAASVPTPPDLSTMSPRERFNRLYQRVITAAQSGDQATVKQFTPMAVAAFGQLDRVDPDARYHLAMLELHVGDLTGADAQADSLRMLEPRHLFGYVIGAAVASWTKDDARRVTMDRAFLTRYDAEMATKKPEYLEHQAMLVEVKRQADSMIKTP